MAITIDLCASASYGNTKAISCDPKRANVVSVIAGGKIFEPADYASMATFKAVLLAACKVASSESGKLFPFPQVSGVTVDTEANKEFTFGNGTKITTSEGAPSYTFDLYIGTNLERQLRRFNSQTIPVFIFDDAGNVWGKVDSDGNFSGIDATLFTSGAPFGDYNTPGIAKLKVAFSSASDVYDASRFVNTDFAISEIVGLFDATLSEATTNTSSAYKIAAKVINTQLGAEKNLYDDYDDLLADEALWTAEVQDTGTAMTITSVAKDDVNECWTVTLDLTEWTALTDGDQIEIGLASPTVLIAAGVTDIEGIAVVVEK
jgi:hypothetical protein